MASLDQLLQQQCDLCEEADITITWQVSDFTAFKDMMLYVKKQREEAANKTDLTKDVSIKSTSIFDVEGMYV